MHNALTVFNICLIPNKAIKQKQKKNLQWFVCICWSGKFCCQSVVLAGQLQGMEVLPRTTAGKSLFSAIFLYSFFKIKSSLHFIASNSFDGHFKASSAFINWSLYFEGVISADLIAVVLSLSLSISDWVAFFNSSLQWLNFHLLFLLGFSFLHCWKVQSYCYLAVSCQKF